MRERPNVMISGTARDLPEHRKEVMDACQRQGMFPTMMEHLPANDADAIRASLDLVDNADIFVGVFAHRYGYVPKAHAISVTEMEYNRAVERKIPRLIFVMDKKHPVLIEDVEMGEAAAKLKAFKERLQTDNIVNFFKSAEELRSLAINSLSHYRHANLTAFHYVSDIPAPPEPYIAHPYTLLQSKGLIGRQAELNLLTDWVAKPAAHIYHARILNIVAIGGMGKSALTWKWFNDIAPQEVKRVNGKEWGRMWWSFYESDATFENFIARALAYVTRGPREEVEKILPPDREAQLLAALDREPFLVVLDGLERILIAYARMDAARLSDDNLDQETVNRVAGAIGLPASAAGSFVGQHRLRKTADLRAGAFLRKLVGVRASRILISTRLYPADLQTVTGESIPGSVALFLKGLADNDALDLWRNFKVTGAGEELLRLLRSFDNHPLLIQALASEIANFRRSPGDFDAWCKANPDFDPFGLPLVQLRSHVLEFALRGLDQTSRTVLRTIAAFRMPANYDTLAALLVGPERALGTERELDGLLSELEDRGLLGWDRRANRYDLHPLVRGVVWSGLDESTRRSTYSVLETHFKSLSLASQGVNCLEDLAGAIELYNTLIGLGRYDDAERLFSDRLASLTIYRLSATRQAAEMLEMLFPDGLASAPRVSRGEQSRVLNWLGQTYHLSDRPKEASAIYRRANDVFKQDRDFSGLAKNFCDLSGSLRLSGSLHNAELAARNALGIASSRADDYRRMIGCGYLGLVLAARGDPDSSKIALNAALKMAQHGSPRVEGAANVDLAKRALWFGAPEVALRHAERALDLASFRGFERDFVRAARLQGAAALNLGQLLIADERLHHALRRARAINFAEEELPSLVALAELLRRQGNLNGAGELLGDVWEPAGRGPYPLLHADAFNVLAQIERDSERRDGAIEAAATAYRLAWCDGPPFAYHWGLEAARNHLGALGAPEPTDLPPFDESKYEPMPKVEINWSDELGRKQAARTL
jgi:tetratricopeptide (TPR) repeat protein